VKRFFAGIVLLCLIFTGCGSPEAVPGFAVQYIRTNGYEEGIEYPYTVIIRSPEELGAYIAANEHSYDFARKERVYSDTTIGFLDAADRYDAAFFEKHALLLVILEEGSGSVRHEVEGIDAPSSDGTPGTIRIRRDAPEVQTADMAEWHIIIETAKEHPILTADSIHIQLH